jgi:hypothetical protein
MLMSSYLEKGSSLSIRKEKAPESLRAYLNPPLSPPIVFSSSSLPPTHLFFFFFSGWLFNNISDQESSLDPIPLRLSWPWRRKSIDILVCPSNWTLNWFFFSILHNPEVRFLSQRDEFQNNETRMPVNLVAASAPDIPDIPPKKNSKMGTFLFFEYENCLLTFSIS